MFGKFKKNICIASIMFNSSVYNSFSMNDNNRLNAEWLGNNNIDRNNIVNAENLNNNNVSTFINCLKRMGKWCLIGFVYSYFKKVAIDYTSIKTENGGYMPEKNGNNIGIKYYDGIGWRDYIPTAIIGDKNKNSNDCESSYEKCSDSFTLSLIDKNLDIYKKNHDYCYGYIKGDKKNQIVYNINYDSNCVLTLNKESVYFNAFKDVHMYKLVVKADNIQHLSSLFYKADIDTLDLTNLNLGNAICIDGMFKYARINEFIGLDNITFLNEISLYDTFCGYRSGGHYLNLSSWELRPSNLSYSFCNVKVKKIDVSNFKVDNMIDLGDYVFYSVPLKEIYIKNWDTRDVTKIGSHFFNYEKLEKVYLNVENNPLIVSNLKQKGFICKNNLCKKTKY